MRTPFLSEEEFNRLKAAGDLKPDCLFPVIHYKFCKYVWENSPLIARLDEEFQKNFPSSNGQD